MVKLSEILSAERVVSGVAASSKKKALEQLASLLSAGTATLTVAEAFASLTTREKLGSTGLGRGVAIPHGRVAGIEECVGAFMRLQYPVSYDAVDDKPVDLIFGLLVPKSASDEQLGHLAVTAKMFTDTEFCDRLRDAQDERTLYELIVGYAVTA